MARIMPLTAAGPILAMSRPLGGKAVEAPVLAEAGPIGRYAQAPSYYRVSTPL